MPGGSHGPCQLRSKHLYNNSILYRFKNSHTHTPHTHTHTHTHTLGNFPVLLVTHTLPSRLSPLSLSLSLSLYLSQTLPRLLSLSPLSLSLSSSHLFLSDRLSLSSLSHLISSLASLHVLSSSRQKLVLIPTLRRASPISSSPLSCVSRLSSLSLCHYVLIDD